MGSCMTVNGQAQEPLFKAPPLLKPRASMALRRQSKKKRKKTTLPRSPPAVCALLPDIYPLLCKNMHLKRLVH